VAKKERNGVQGCLSDIADSLDRIATATEKQAGIIPADAETGTGTAAAAAAAHEASSKGKK